MEKQTNEGKTCILMTLQIECNWIQSNQIKDRNRDQDRDRRRWKEKESTLF